MTTLENRFPLLAVEHGCIISKDADITVAFEGGTTGTLHRDGCGVQAIHSCWCKAIKVLPDFSVVHKQDWFIKERLQTGASEGRHELFKPLFRASLQRASVPENTCYLYLTKTTKGVTGCRAISARCAGDISSRRSWTGKPDQVLGSLRTVQAHHERQRACQAAPLSTDEIVGTEGKTGLIERYFSLMPEGDTTLRDIELSARRCASATTACVCTPSDAEDLPGKVATDTRYEALHRPE